MLITHPDGFGGVPEHDAAYWLVRYREESAANIRLRERLQEAEAGAERLRVAYSQQRTRADRIEAELNAEREHPATVSATSGHALSQDLAALACTVAAVSPELADRAAALEVSRNQWRQIAQRAISANDCSLVRAEAAETLLTTERAARELAERRLAALESEARTARGERNEQLLVIETAQPTLTDTADAIIAEQATQPHQEAPDADAE